MAENNDIKNRQKSLADRHLSNNLPKPNIVRIEVLDGEAKKQYLGDIQQISNRVKAIAFNTLVNERDKVFYGFLKATGDQTIGFNSNWAGSEGDGGLLGSVKALASQVAGAGVAALTGGTASQGASTITGTIDRASDVLRDLTGISASNTGSASALRYSGVQLNGSDIACGWYLPEQIDLCTRSLEIINRMAYPVHVPDGAVAPVINATRKELGNIVANATGLGSDGPVPQDSGVASIITNVLDSTTSISVDLIKKINSAFGRNFTLDPLPVKLSIGHYIEVEPLVITKVEILFSKETFINKDGRHLPLFCTLNLSFAYWMNPTPKLDFMSLLGKKMFGTGAPDVQTTNKSTEQKTKEQIAKQEQIKETKQGGAFGQIGVYAGLGGK